MKTAQPVAQRDALSLVPNTDDGSSPMTMPQWEKEEAEEPQPSIDPRYPGFTYTEFNGVRHYTSTSKPAVGEPFKTWVLVDTLQATASPSEQGAGNRSPQNVSPTQVNVASTKKPLADAHRQ